MKPHKQKKPQTPRDLSDRPSDPISGTEHDFNAGSVEEWEERVFTAATTGGYFTTWRKAGVGRGKVRKFPCFAEAAIDAWNDPRALVYAVTATGRSVCIVRSQWKHYLGVLKHLIDAGQVK